MNATEFLFLAAAGALGGAINSMAGGGTLVTFPAALAAGLSGVAASATSSVSLLPGALAATWAYRRELEGCGRLLRWLALPAVVGGLLGARLLISSEERVFTMIVPWMVLGATLLIVGKDLIWRRVQAAGERASSRRLVVVGLSILTVAIYAGYFGAGKNIVLLALLTLVQRMSIHQVNAIKSAVVCMMTTVTTLFFLLGGIADPWVALALAVGSIVGSYCGASVARRVRPERVRHAVVAVGLSLTAVLAYRVWLI